MKNLIFILLFFSNSAFGQCDSRAEAPTFSIVPSFISLFNRGLCVSGSIMDTIICVEVEASEVNRIASFSFSSPNGSGVTLNGIKVYDENCTLISQGSEVPASNEKFTICYSISANVVDNFCPYMLRINPLVVEWGNVSCSYSQGKVSITWTTLSNKNTHYFEVWISQDAAVWKRIASLPPKKTTSSSESSYSFSSLTALSGLNYVMIREVDFNGEISIAPLCYFEAGYNYSPSIGFDILGRQMFNADYFYYIRK